MGRPRRDPMLAAQLRERARGLAAFDCWQQGQPERRSLDSVFRGLGTLYALLPPDVRGRCDDPEYRGVARMHAALARLGTGHGR